MMRGQEDKRMRARRGPEARKRGGQGPEEETKDIEVSHASKGQANKKCSKHASKDKNTRSQMRASLEAAMPPPATTAEAALMNSATGTRTRVARVRAEYPSQLDYSGCWTHLW